MCIFYKMIILLVVLCIFHNYIECAKIIYYSNEEKKSYDDAEKYCNSINSKMLTYGSTVVDAAKKCNMAGLAWLSKPWIKYRGCYIHSDADQTLTSRSLTTNITLSECVTFCDGDTHMYISLTVDKCICCEKFTDELKDSDSECSKCPGNEREKCGTNNHIALYEKGETLKKEDDSYNSIHRQSFQHSKGITVLYEHEKEVENSFFCKYLTDKANVSSTVEIYCDLPENLPLTTSTTTSATTSTTTSAVWNTTTMKMEEKGPSNEGIDTVLIYGILGGGLACVLLIIVIIVCQCQKRYKNLKRNKAVTEAPTLQSPKEGNYDLPEIEKNNGGNDVYDHASHALLRVENTGNIYDHANSPEGLYNTTVCGSENKNIVENIYDHSSEHPDKNEDGDILSEYDTCNNVQRIE